MTPEEWFSSIPYVTKRYFLLVVSTTLLSTFNILSPNHIALYSPYILEKYELWRLFTAYLFFGPLSLGFLFAMGLLLQYSRNLESEYYSGSGRNRMDFLWTFFLGWAIFTPIFLFVVPSFFPGPIMISFLGYLWSRKDPFRPISVYGFTLKAWHTPLVFIFFDLVMQNPLLPTIIAIFVGHLVHMLQNMVPRRYGYNPVKCPEFLLDLGDKWLSGGSNNSFDTSPAPAAQPPGGPAWAQGGGRRF